MKNNHRLRRRVSLGLVMLAVTVPTILMSSGIANAAEAPSGSTSSATDAADGQAPLLPPVVSGVIQDGFDALNPVLNGLPGVPLPPLL